MGKVNTIDLARPRRTHRSINEFEEGDEVGRIFNDGYYYTGRIVSAPKLLPKDEGTNRFVCTRRIKYHYDNQEEDADEEPLNEWSSNEMFRKDTMESWLVLGKGMYDGSFLSMERLDEKDVIRSSDNRSKEGNMVTPPPTKTKPPSLHSQENAPKRRMDNTGQRRSKRTKSKPKTFYPEALASTPNHPSSSATSTKKKSKKMDGIVKKTKEEARKEMMHKMGTSEEEIDSVLEEMSPPYELNEAYNTIIKKRQQGLCKKIESSERFYPKRGLRDRIPQGGWNWHGSVISDKPVLVKPDGEEKAVEMWTVEYDEGGET